MSSLTKELDRVGDLELPRKWQRCSPEVKQEFFGLFARLGSVTEAAKALGLDRNTCYAWVRRAGLSKKRSEQPSREEFLQLRSTGLLRHEAAAQLGIHATTAQEWDTGIRRTQHGAFMLTAGLSTTNKG